jgi:hypothetical protein
MKNTMEIQEILYAPWSLHFDRDGTEDTAVLCDAEGEELVSSRPFWLPEANDPMPPILAAMQLMKSAPELLETLESLLTHISELEGISSVIDEDLMKGDAFGQAVALLAELKSEAR